MRKTALLLAQVLIGLIGVGIAHGQDEFSVLYSYSDPPPPGCDPKTTICFSEPKLAVLNSKNGSVISLPSSMIAAGVTYQLPAGLGTSISGTKVAVTASDPAARGANKIGLYDLTANALAILPIISTMLSPSVLSFNGSKILFSFIDSAAVCDPSKPCNFRMAVIDSGTGAISPIPSSVVINGTTYVLPAGLGTSIAGNEIAATLSDPAARGVTRIGIFDFATSILNIPTVPQTNPSVLSFDGTNVLYSYSDPPPPGCDPKTTICLSKPTMAVLNTKSGSVVSLPSSMIAAGVTYELPAGLGTSISGTKVAVTASDAAARGATQIGLFDLATSLLTILAAPQSNPGVLSLSALSSVNPFLGATNFAVSGTMGPYSVDQIKFPGVSIQSVSSPGSGTTMSVTISGNNMFIANTGSKPLTIVVTKNGSTTTVTIPSGGSLKLVGPGGAVVNDLLIAPLTPGAALSATSGSDKAFPVTVQKSYVGKGSSDKQLAPVNAVLVDPAAGAETLTATGETATAPFASLVADDKDFTQFTPNALVIAPEGRQIIVKDESESPAQSCAATTLTFADTNFASPLVRKTFVKNVNTGNWVCAH